jgi:hypothetical protein
MDTLEIASLKFKEWYDLDDRLDDWVVEARFFAVGAGIEAVNSMRKK